MGSEKTELFFFNKIKLSWIFQGSMHRGLHFWKTLLILEAKNVLKIRILHKVQLQTN